ncbi:MAG: response regulator [Planctomycetota bacterium]|jgi:excisionase family DNA binding protein
MADRDHLSLGRIAKHCHVSRTTVYRWIINGHLKAYSLPSGHFRVRPSDLADFCKDFGIPYPLDEAPVDAASTKPSADLKVLISDDHPDIVELLAQIVDQTLPGATIQRAANGVDACIQAANFHPDVMLLDIMMPGMDGFLVMQELLRREELADTRVIVISGFEPFDRIAALEQQYPQVVACLAKPVDVGQLTNTLRSCCAVSR